MAGRFKPITFAAVVFFLVAAVAPLFVSSWATLFALILAKSIVVLGIMLLLQAGQVSFGHAMFFTTGAYTAAFWGKYVGGGDILLYLVLGGVSSTVFGLDRRPVRGALPRNLLRHAQPRLLDGAVVAAGEDVPLHQRRRRHPRGASAACWDFRSRRRPSSTSFCM